ncbi:MAG: nickel-dependent hydrogenase large subunit [Candidatus Diapherotrites archaeon]
MNGMELEIESMTKIEGHTGLKVKISGNKVEKVELRVSENKRFFEEAVIRKNFNEIPFLVSRICGTCSSSHLLASVKAIENAFDVRQSPQTLALRTLLINATMLRDHGMHLYYFVLPDLFEKESILDFNGKLEKWVRDSMSVRNAGVQLAEAVGGRSIHPLTPLIGGFSKTPEKEKLNECVKSLKRIRLQVIDLIDLFYNHKINFERKTDYVCLAGEPYNFLEGEIINSRGICIPEDQMLKYVEEFVIPYSSASQFEFDDKAYMVGALSRLNLNKYHLHNETKNDVMRAVEKFPSNSCFDNNLAQAVEMLHCIDYSIELIELNDFVKEEVPAIEPIESEGIGVVEAPRGTLYHEYHFNEEGKATHCNIIIPTAQNAKNIEHDIKDFIEPKLSLQKEALSLECEKVVRAYDPCMSCATHFLKVEWL